jgi:DNA-binding CsgD family transcriptional regulator
MLADGEGTREIAVRLNYSERTVKNIVHDLLIKLNCKTRAHAVALAARRGVI